MFLRILGLLLLWLALDFAFNIITILYLSEPSFIERKNASITTEQEPLQHLNLSNASIVYHVGWDDPFGQTNNKLVAILHALDQAFDEHGEIAHDGSNATAVVAVSGWARDVLGLWLSPNLFDPYLDYNWTFSLGKNLPIVDYARVKQGILPNAKEMVKLPAIDAFYYSKSHLNMLFPHKLQRRRTMILRKLWTMIPENRYSRLNDLKAYLKERGFGQRYVTIHLRSMDLQCVQRVGPYLTPYECEMDPMYIKRLLFQYYGNTLNKIPIVVITDMQRRDLLQRLSFDPEIGRNVIVTSLHLPKSPWRTQVIQDMVVAVNSDLFIGPRVSTMTVMIGMMRVAMGADPQTNLVYVQKKWERRYRYSVFKRSSFEVCGDCIFYCNASSSTMCGKANIYA